MKNIYIYFILLWYTWSSSLAGGWGPDSLSLTKRATVGSGRAADLQSFYLIVEYEAAAITNILI